MIPLMPVVHTNWMIFSDRIVTIYYNTLIIIPITESFNNLIKGPHQANITSKILTNTVMSELIHTSCRSESSNCSLVILDKLLHVLQ